MLYLNDQIIFNIPANQVVLPDTTQVIPGYQKYEVHLDSPHWENTTNYELIYSGRLFSYKQYQTLYMNDILSSFSTAYLWMNNEMIRLFMSYPDDNIVISLQPQQRLFSTLKITYPSLNLTESEDICFMNLDKRLKYTPIIPSLDWFKTTNNYESFNILSQRTDILPRIPRLNIENSKFFVGGIFGVNAKWVNSYGKGEVYPAILNKNKTVITSVPTSYNTTSPVQSILLRGDIISNNLNSDGKYIAVVNPTSPNTAPIILAEYDECNSDYYLIWCDRTGGYQCQPFSKRSVMNENISTTLLVNMYDESRPMLKSVSNKWELNSDWLTYDEYKAYESIFTSPYIYLYDVKYNQLTSVLCNERDWVEKTKDNTNRPFNLKITLTSSLPQNILY